MTITELLPTLAELNHSEKLQAVQFLVSELANEEADTASGDNVPRMPPELDANVTQAVEFYRTHLQAQLEPEHNGDNVAIHLSSGSYVVDRWAGKALRTLSARHPEGGAIVVHKIGPDYDLASRIRGERPI